MKIPAPTPVKPAALWVVPLILALAPWAVLGFVFLNPTDKEVHIPLCAFLVSDIAYWLTWGSLPLALAFLLPAIYLRNRILFLWAFSLISVMQFMIVFPPFVVCAA